MSALVPICARLSAPLLVVTMAGVLLAPAIWAGEVVPVTVTVAGVTVAVMLAMDGVVVLVGVTPADMEVL